MFSDIEKENDDKTNEEDQGKQSSPFDKKAAKRFRENILERGGTEKAADLYRRFRGQEPTIDALLKRNGITRNNG